MEPKEFCKNIGLNYEDLEWEFNVSDIEHITCKKLAERILDKIEKYRKLLEEYMNADGSSIAVLMEIKDMDDNDKDKMNELYQQMIVLEREFLVMELDNSDMIEFVKTMLETWSKLKTGLKCIIVKAKESWKKETNVQEKLGYLG